MPLKGTGLGSLLLSKKEFEDTFLSVDNVEVFRYNTKNSTYNISALFNLFVDLKSSDDR